MWWHQEGREGQGKLRALSGGTYSPMSPAEGEASRAGLQDLVLKYQCECKPRRLSRTQTPNSDESTAAPKSASTVKMNPNVTPAVSTDAVEGTRRSFPTAVT